MPESFLMYINSGKSKCSSEVVYKVKLFLWSNVSLVMMWWLAKQSEIILSVLLIFWFIIKNILGVGILLFFSLFLFFLWVCFFFFELVVRQMFRSDILLGFLLRFLYKNIKCLPKIWVAIFYFPLIILLGNLSLHMCVVGVMSINFTWFVSLKNVHRCLHVRYVDSRQSLFACLRTL